jgi:hypothetical protein
MLLVPHLCGIDGPLERLGALQNVLHCVRRVQKCDVGLRDVVISRTFAAT